MLDKYQKKQNMFYNFIIKCFENSKISHAYLIELNNVSYGFALAIDLVKFFLCNGKYNEKICKLVDNNSYDNFFLIDDDKVIKKDIILELQKRFSLKTLNSDEKKVYLIKDATLLNDSSANSLLKFLEEPQDDIIAILLTDNASEVKDTIRSRCQEISLVNNTFDYKKLFDYCDFSDKNQDEVISVEYNKFLNFYKNLEEQNVLFLKNKDVYGFCDNINELLKFGIYLYFDLINVILDNDLQCFLPDNIEKQEILSKNNLETVLKKLDVINNFIFYNRYNVNKNLFLDNFIIKFGGV